MKKLTFQQKLWAPLICSLFCIIGVFLFDAIQTRNMRMEERSNDLANVNDVALSVVKQYGELAQAGTLTKEVAQQQAMAMVKNLRYGKDGYISITSMDGIALMNPFKPENDGKNLYDFKDANGTYLYHDIIAAGKSASGNGFVRYVWPRPGTTESVAKLSRVTAYKPWDWVLVTGVYIDDIDNAFYSALLRSSAVLFGVCVVLVLIVRVVNRSLRHAIGGAPEYAAEVASRIADNDLSFSITTHKDDRQSILFAMKAMQTNLAETIGEIRHSAIAIATASSEIASGNMDLSARTESQASSLEETSASMEELTTTVVQNADNAQQANQLTKSAAEIAEKGGTVVANVIDTMGTINNSANRIVDIISVIDGIAFQTNILALNAAVEAARAGEQGRGFAVVATEVRSLAQRSATAAKEIKELIGNSVESISVGSALVEQAGTTMNQVVSSVSRVTDIMAEIAAASSEQRTGIAHVNQAIIHMDSVTQQNAALVEQAAAAAASMQEQAANLEQLVSRFNLGQEGQGAARPAATPARAPAIGRTRPLALG
jgi:methyl-accepting chemotaxis protein